MKKIKWFFQRLFRTHHCADLDLWSLDYHLAEIILPKLIAFRKYHKHGYPMTFCTWEEFKDIGQYKTKSAYNKAIKNGEIMGGGMDKWEEILDEMIFGLEFCLWSLYHKSQPRFIKKYGDPNEKKSENKKNLKFNIKGFEDYYFDVNMYRGFEKRAQNGLELFGKYYFSLWD